MFLRFCSIGSNSVKSSGPQLISLSTCEVHFQRENDKASSLFGCSVAIQLKLKGCKINLLFVQRHGCNMEFLTKIEIYQT